MKSADCCQKEHKNIADSYEQLLQRVYYIEILVCDIILIFRLIIESNTVSQNIQTDQNVFFSFSWEDIETIAKIASKFFHIYPEENTAD